MRDKQLIFGEVIAVTKSTPAYAADILDMGDLSEIRTGRVEAARLVLEITLAGGTGDTAIPILADCDTSGGTYTIIREGKAVSAEGLGDRFYMEVPAEHRRYLKAGIIPGATGASIDSACKGQMWIQLGVEDA